MDKNQITGFVLIFLVLIGFTYFSQPSKEQLEQQKHDNDSIALAEANKTAQEQQEKAQKVLDDSLALADTVSLFANAKRGNGTVITLQNELVSLDFDTKGGVITKATLKTFTNQNKNNVVLFDEETSKLNYTLALKEENLRTAECVFMPENVSDSTVTMRLNAKDGSSLAFEYKLMPNTYLVNLAIKSESGLERHCLPNINHLGIEWQDAVRQQEKGYSFESQYSTLTYHSDEDGTDHLSERKADEESPKETLNWIAYKNQFFSYVMIAYQGLADATMKSTPFDKGSGFLKNCETIAQTAFDPTGKQPTTMQFYIGPNKFRILQEMNNHSLDKKDLDLEQLVYLGWPLIRYINRFFTIYIFDWLTGFGLSMGIVLLLITILLKIIVYPTTRKSYLSSAKMRVLKPKLDAIGAKYPDPADSMKKQQEIMATYSQYGANPMGGCLPVLIQMPIWIAMFNFVPNAIELRQQSFLWADDLSTYDDIIHWNTSLPLIGDHLSIFCLLFCAFNLIYSWINMKMQKDSMAGQQAEQMKKMQWMMMLMPLFFFFMFNDYSSGLNYYYFISLLCSVITMWYLRWSTDDRELLEKLEANYEKNKNNPAKMRGLAARLEALQKQQEAQMKMRQGRR